MKELSLPASRKDTGWLRAGDLVFLTGEVVTARDQAHLRLAELLRKGKDPPLNLKDGALYHCGPLAKREGREWRILSAGPTTSSRMDSLLPLLLPWLGVRVVIGKGGVGRETAEVMKEQGCVYLAFPGGCGALAARAVEEVRGVYWLELGIPEAMWVLRVRGLGPMVVAIDSRGRNLYEEVRRGMVI
ncbi:MAG: FumA C-terminus/TtdB family hydratase beta subunit [Candidatus Hadarchaeales archaeon]